MDLQYLAMSRCLLKRSPEKHSALVSIHKGLGGVWEPTETLETRKAQMWLQSSFLVVNKSSSGSFPHGQGLLHSYL